MSVNPDDQPKPPSPPGEVVRGDVKNEVQRQEDHDMRDGENAPTADKSGKSSGKKVVTKKEEQKDDSDEEMIPV